MQIRRRIFLTYLLLIGIVLFYTTLSGVTHRLRLSAETDRSDILELKNTWNGTQVALSDMIINWDDGRAYRRLTTRRNSFADQLERRRDRFHSARIYPAILLARFDSLAEAWGLAEGHLERIARVVEHPNFRAAEAQVQRQPGLQRLSHVWIELASSDSLRDRRLAHTIQEFFGQVEYFSLYSEPVEAVLDTILLETTTVLERIVTIERVTRFLFFLIFIVAYILISLRFSHSLSAPIVYVARRLKQFMGLAGAPAVPLVEDELVVLSDTVDYMIQHYTGLAERALGLSVGQIDTAELRLRDRGGEGVVEQSLSDIAEYLQELAQTSTWIRDGAYGTRVKERSPDDVLAKNFNVMSRVIHEKITTLQGMFEAVDEGVVVVDEHGEVREANERFCKLFGIDASEPTPRREQYRFVIDQIRSAGRTYPDSRPRDNEYVTIRGVKNGEIPLRITSKSLPAPDEGGRQTMFLLMDESRRARQKREKDRLKAQATEAELRALRAQINPHFLFNTLNTIAFLVETDSESAVGTLEKLADLFRYALASTRRPTVPLSEELLHIRRFSDIELLRYGDRLNVEIKVDKTLEKQAVPPMLLQPLVENAIRYGGDQDGNVNVRIHVYRGQDAMHIEVRDCGTGQVAPEQLLQKSGTGIRNVNSRLKTLYGRPLIFRRGDPCGIVADISVPLEVR